MELVNHSAEEYAAKYSSPLDSLLSEIESYTLRDHPHAQMLSGHVQGKLLGQISNMIRPLSVLEIGTFTGFSAICLASGMREGGRLHTIELRAEDAAIAKEYFDRSEFKDRIFLHVGNAMDIIPGLNEEWDLVFIDADKTGYLDYYKMVLPRVKKGGWILADNTLFHGQVLENPPSGKNAKAIHAFNEYVAADETVEQVMLTVRDGLLLIRKQ